MKKLLRALEWQHDYGFLAGFILILFSFEKKKKSTEVSLRTYNPHFSFLSREERWWIHVHCNRGKKKKVCFGFTIWRKAHWNGVFRPQKTTFRKHQMGTHGLPRGRCTWDQGVLWNPGLWMPRPQSHQPPSQGGVSSGQEEACSSVNGGEGGGGQMRKD